MNRKLLIGMGYGQRNIGENMGDRFIFPQDHSGTAVGFRIVCEEKHEGISDRRKLVELGGGSEAKEL